MHENKGFLLQIFNKIKQREKGKNGKGIIWTTRIKYLFLKIPMIKGSTKFGKPKTETSKLSLKLSLFF